MSNWPAVTIQICTFERPDEIKKTIMALRNHLVYPNLHWMICDDHSSINYLRYLEKEFNYAQIVRTDKRSGWGVNVNEGLARVKSRYVFFCEDDYVLYRMIDLRVGVALMETEKKVGLIRYDGVSGHRFIASLDETDISEKYPDYREGCALSGKTWYWRILSQSGEAYVYSNRPHLKAARFHKYYGNYPQNKKLGETETEFAIRVKSKLDDYDAPQIVTPVDFVVRYWEHIGVSRQLTPDDKGE